MKKYIKKDLAVLLILLSIYTLVMSILNITRGLSSPLPYDQMSYGIEGSLYVVIHYCSLGLGLSLVRS